MDRARLAVLIEASRQAQFDLSVDEWREIVYLAAVFAAAGPPQPAAPSDRAAPKSESHPQSPERPDAVMPGPSPEPEPEPPSHPAWPQAGGDRATGTDLLVLPYRPDGEPGGLPVRAPASQPLARGAIARALRPVKRTFPDLFAVEVDVAETARRAAESAVWLPALVAVRDRWLNLALVVDDAASGPAWAREIRSLVRAVEESGAFGDVRLWRFDSDAGAGSALTVSGGTATAEGGRDPRELVDPSGRRAILVLSDCVGAGWADGRVGDMVLGWVRTNAVAIVHLLPQRLWNRCASRFVPVDWSVGQPFATPRSRGWRAQMGDPLTERPADVAGAGRPMVPVLDLSASALHGWATMVAGGAPRWMKGVAFDPASRGHVASEADPAAGGADEDAARRQVRRFRAAASPEAFRLATRLSAAPLQLSVVHLIQRTVPGAGSSTYWAEILLSGLVARSPGRGLAGEPVFAFVPGVREQLMTGLTRQESLDVLREVSEFVSTRLGGSFDFLALMMLDAAPDEGLAEAERPFARVAVQVLRSLGGVYADKADAIAQFLPSGALQILPADIPGRDGDSAVTVAEQPRSTPGSEHRISSPDQVWDVPQRTQHFTGRRALLDKLRQDLVEKINRAAVLVPRALFGLGGVGKTALANEYAHRYRHDYDVVWWIPAEDPADVRRSLAELSRRLRLPENTDQAETIRILLNALNSGYPKSRWLLVYDNATGPDSIKDLLPRPKSNGHVLITSRDESWQSQGQLLEVDVFTREESAMLLRRRAPTLSDADADLLAELLQDLPLALHQAAAWHAETGLPAADYQRRYDEKLALLGEVELPREYPRPVGAAFGVSYDQLQDRSVAAAQLLQLCSYFGPEPIFVEMLYNARNVTGLPQPLARQMADRSTIGRELREVARYELIRFDQARGRFQLHRLVQSVLRRTLPPERRQTTPQQAHSILALANPGNPDELGIVERARHGQLSPHIQPSGIVESEDAEARRVVLDQVRYRYLVGDFVGSRDLAESTVNRWTQQWGERDEFVLLARRHLATTLRTLGQVAAATAIDEEVLRLFQETLGEDNDHYLVTANGYAADLRAAGRFREALAFDRALLTQHRRVLRDDDPATLRTANNYAVDLRLMGQFGAARDLGTETVRFWTEGYGSDFPDTLFSVSNLVRDYYGLGQYGEGLTMQQDVIAMHEAASGTSHLSVLMARRTIAMLLRKLGRHREARERAEVNFSAFAAQLPDHHEHTLIAAVSLGNALRDENNRDMVALQRARKIIGDALDIYERHFVGHPFVEVCKTNLAIVLRRLGEVAAARALNADARIKLAAALSESHPYTLCATTNLANDLAAMGDYDEARKYSGEVLEFSRQDTIRGTDHPYTLAATLNHALNLEGAGREHEAKTLLRTAVDGFDRVLGPDHPDSQAARNHQRIDADIEPPPT